MFPIQEHCVTIFYFLTQWYAKKLCIAVDISENRHSKDGAIFSREK